MRRAGDRAGRLWPRQGPVGAGTVARAASWALAGLALVTAAACGAGHGGDPSGESGGATGDRQVEVAERGADIMPFDLDVTTHRFRPADDGLVQTVVADDPDDLAQVALVREHLTTQAERFSAGDYGDPAAVHGNDMPGLAELESGAEDIGVAYAEVAAGATITYTTDDPELVTALHRWAEAQVSDHGAHAEHDGT